MKGYWMKPTQIEPQRTAAAVVEALEVLGVAPGDAEVYLLEMGPDSDGAAMMLATRIGMLIMTTGSARDRTGHGG
jgi:hypothetical protein